MAEVNGNPGKQERPENIPKNGRKFSYETADLAKHRLPHKKGSWPKVQPHGSDGTRTAVNRQRVPPKRTDYLIEHKVKMNVPLEGESDAPKPWIVYKLQEFWEWSLDRIRTTWQIFRDGMRDDLRRM